MFDYRIDDEQLINLRARVLRRIGLILMFTALATQATFALEDFTLTVWVCGLAVGAITTLAILHRAGVITGLDRAVDAHAAATLLSQELGVRRKLDDGAVRGCVYVLRDVDVTGWYKIGKTTKPVERIGHFDTHLPFAVSVVHIIPAKDCTQLETVLHRQFADKRMRGEWFALSDSDVQWIMRMEAN